MTITNDERRNIAARLRHVAGHGAPEWATTACCIAECLGEHDYPLWNDSKPLFNRLADLIEPEPEQTCHHLDYITDPWGDKYKKCCGNCSLWEQSWCDEGECMCKAPDCPRNYFADCEPCSYFEAVEWPCFGFIKD